MSLRAWCLVYYYSIIIIIIIITGRPARSAAMPLLFLLSGPKKWVFRPAGATRCPYKREIHVYRGRNVGIQPQNCQNFDFGHNFVPQGRLVAVFLRNAQRL